MWSEASHAYATWNVTRQKEYDAGGNEHEWIELECGAEHMRLSPNYTQEELDEYVFQINIRQSHDLNTPIDRSRFSF